MNALLVRCPHCVAEPDQRCTTVQGGTARSTHRVRWDHLASKRRRGFVAEVVETDERLGIQAGEHYWVQPYRYDPAAKVTLLRRVPDGFDPECNQYNHEVRFVAWDAPEESGDGSASFRERVDAAEPANEGTNL